MSAGRRLLITPGMGIGPEVTLKALAADGWQDLVLVGRRGALDAANAAVGLPLVAVDRLDPRVDGLPVFDPGDATEPAEVAAIRLSAEACLAGTAAALVTGPIHKARLVERGFAFRGHTDFLGHLCGARREVMAFVGGELRVALVTTHIPLMAVGEALQTDDIIRVVRTAAVAVEQDLGLPRPRIAVCGLNPHAGEGGLLGREELDTIGPACAALRTEGLHILGPVSAETAFLQARTGAADLIVAMYHDQGLAPLKAVDFGRSVNWTLGLPIVRTSVDHGTADALMGTGQADPASMRAAIGLARRVVARRSARA
jgi:4-hydroxythreonine-4-phosphate dehydrogenase